MPHTRIFDLPRDANRAGDANALPASLVAALADTANGEVPLDDVVEPAPQSISLNVSSSCNLSCSYCYAARGSFQGAQRDQMPWEVARAAIDKLLCGAEPLSPITVGFLGGEPFVNRRLIHRAVEYAAEEGSKHGLDVRFSVTTNGTLLQEEDVELLRKHRFAVTVSIDGGEQIQDLQKPTSEGRKGSYELLFGATRSLLGNPGSAQVAARSTVTRGDFNLRERFETVLSIGFREMGFAPLRAAKPGGDALRDEDWPRYLQAIVEVGQSELERVRQGEPIRFTNLAVALKQLHRGASSPYPCGAGGGYFSVAANGDWYACHRAMVPQRFAWAITRHSTWTSGGNFCAPGTCTRSRPAASAGPAICVLGDVIRKFPPGRTPCAILFGVGWSSVWRRIASFQYAGQSFLIQALDFKEAWV